MINKCRSILVAGAFALLCVPASARAQGFISPFIGFNTATDAACTISNCNGKSTEVGVSLGQMGSLFGIGVELGYAKDFFQDPLLANSSMLTLMTEISVGPRIKVVRPYASVGFGLLRSNMALVLAPDLVVTNNDFGWSVG
ncbi:MAG: hypothetical protein LBQ09_00255, partial [Acidobacteriaceae bacterium]|nr:hypothetical protein [Acidobacteriaceae bacterium]